MSENTTCCKSCVNRSPARSPTREQSVPIPPPLSAGDEGNPALQIDESLNKIYETRLAEINEEANGDATLKEITYKEWIHMLRKINLTLLKSIQEMEHETAERLTLMQRLSNSNCRYGSTDDLCKCRKDMAGLMQLVRNGRKSGDWNIDRYNFETITEQDIFGNDKSHWETTLKHESECNKQSSISDPQSCSGQKSKLIANVRALAFEVADKHDEIRDLKKQVLSMEDEIQKAQKKIQLKDDVIRELRSDLKALPKSPVVWGARIADQTSPSISPIMSEMKSAESCNLESPSTNKAANCYSSRDSVTSNSCCFQMDSLLEINDDEDEDEELRKCLKEEFCHLLQMKSKHDQNIDVHRREIEDKKRLISEMIDKLLKNNNDLRIRVRFYRQELTNLEIPQSSRTLTLRSDGDSGISSDSDTDVKLINLVRNRLRSSIEENQRLRMERQCLQIKCEEANSKTIAKTELLEKSSKALREVVNSLTNAQLSKPIAYDKIFEECQTKSDNPIVEAVGELMEMLKERDETIDDLRRQIASTKKVSTELESNSQQLRAELCELKNSISRQKEQRELLFRNQEFSKLIYLEVNLKNSQLL